MEFISYSEVLYQINRTDKDGKPIPFSFTCSTSKGTFLTVNRAVKNVLKTIHEKEASGQQQASGKALLDAHSLKLEADKEMFIRILDLDTGDIKTVYPRTFIFFNGFKVSPEL